MGNSEKLKMKSFKDRFKKLKLKIANDIIEIQRPPIDLTFWESLGQMAIIAKCGDSWWNKVQTWLNYLPQNVDIDKVPIQIVDYIAYQRDIERFQNEPEDMYRRRVKYAFSNAKSAGELAGFFTIWENLQLGALQQSERISKEDWDVILLEVDEDSYAKNQTLFDFIVHKYGRSCRRYWFSTYKIEKCRVRVFEFEYQNLLCCTPQI